MKGLLLKIGYILFLTIFSILATSIAIGEETELDPIIVKNGETYDGMGSVLYTTNYGHDSNKPLIILEQGANIKNVRISLKQKKTKKFNPKDIRSNKRKKFPDNPKFLSKIDLTFNSNKIFCYGDNILENIIWDNAGENIVTIKNAGTVILKNSKVFDGSKKLFQINAPCTFKLINVTVDKFDNIIRQNGGTKFKVDIFINNCTFLNGKECIAKTDSKLTQLYFDNIKLTQMPIFWKFPSLDQVHGTFSSIVFIKNPKIPITPPPHPILIGDVNGDLIINIIDALMIAQNYIGGQPFPFNKLAADVNCDAKIDIIDALIVAQYYVKIINSFVQEDCI